jgi:LysM repeat protein
VIRLEAGVPLYNNPVTGPAQEGGLQPDGVYIARTGDSLARIAFLYQTTVAALLAENPEIRMDKVILPGQSIRLPKDAKLEKGWVGVSNLFPDNYETIEVRVVDFPPYADLKLNLGVLDIDNTVLAYETSKGRTDARGQARIEIDIPYYAWNGEEWVVEVVTTSTADRTRAISPVMTIQ